MNVWDAIEQLGEIGVKTQIVVKRDAIVELLFWETSLGRLQHFCLVADDETIPEDAAQSVRDWVEWSA